MSRLDPNGGDFDPAKKRVVNVGPSAAEIKERVSGAPEGEPVDQGEIKTAASYSKRVQLRRQQTNSLKKKTQVGGAPPLDPEKMHALADSMMPQVNFPQDDEEPRAEREPVEPPEMPTGVGSAYAINQEIAKGNVKKPVSMKEARTLVEENRKSARKPLSQESLKALQKVKDAEEEEFEEEEELEEDTTSEDLDRAAEEMVGGPKEMFDFNAISEATRSLTDKKRREEIESRLDDLDIADMITKREIVQTVPILEGKLHYKFRTFNQAENLFCLQYIYDHPGSPFYTEELLNTCKLVCSLVAVNNAELPEHRKNPGKSSEEVSKELFEKKMKVLSSFPVQMIADVSVNAIWFNDRVTRLFSLDNLKNG